MNTFSSLLNEYEKGNGRLFAYTTENEYRDSVICSLEKANIAWLARDEVGKKNTVFFGDPNSIESLRIFLGLNLGFAGVDADSILDAMLGNNKKRDCIGLYNTPEIFNANDEHIVLQAG